MISYVVRYEAAGMMDHDGGGGGPGAGGAAKVRPADAAAPDQAVEEVSAFESLWHVVLADMDLRLDTLDADARRLLAYDQTAA